MITLENGHIQDASSLPIVPNGYMELYLNMDGTVIAPPYGQVLGGPTNFDRVYFDANADILPTQPAGGKKEMLDFNLAGVVAVLVNAVKELSEKVSRLEAGKKQGSTSP